MTYVNGDLPVAETAIANTITSPRPPPSRESFHKLPDTEVYMPIYIYTHAYLCVYTYMSIYMYTYIWFCMSIYEHIYHHIHTLVRMIFKYVHMEWNHGDREWKRP
jgi:hypothetical protein